MALTGILGAGAFETLNDAALLDGKNKGFIAKAKGIERSAFPNDIVEFIRYASLCSYFADFVWFPGTYGQNFIPVPSDQHRILQFHGTRVVIQQVHLDAQHIIFTDPFAAAN